MKTGKETEQKAWLNARKTASYTVEAALIMAITLFLIAALLQEAFQVHSEVASCMVLQQTLEQMGYMEEKQTEAQIGQRGNEDLHTYFRCENRSLTFEMDGQTRSGRIEGIKEYQITVKKFEPEKFLRLLRAVGK